jgi:hypothetical protein
MFVHYTGQRIFWPILTIKLTKKEKSRYFTFLLYPESILKSNSGILRMFFDGAYQTNQRKMIIEEQKRTTE